MVDKNLFNPFIDPEMEDTFDSQSVQVQSQFHRLRRAVEKHGYELFLTQEDIRLYKTDGNGKLEPTTVEGFKFFHKFAEQLRGHIHSWSDTSQKWDEAITAVVLLGSDSDQVDYVVVKFSLI